MSIKTLYKIDNERHDRWGDENFYVVPIEINKETTRSWVIEKGFGKPENVNKKTLLGTPDYGGISEQYYETEQDAKDYIWYLKNRRELYRKFENLRNISQIKQIAKILGVPTNE